jgi:hypothetical protein
VVVEQVEEVDGSVRIWAYPRAMAACCPGRGGESDRVHSRYERGLADAAVAGPRVEIRLRMWRFSAMAKGVGGGLSSSRSSADHALCVVTDELDRADAMVKAMLGDAEKRGSVLGVAGATGRRGVIALRRGARSPKLRPTLT